MFTYRRRVLIRDENLTYFVETAAIDWLESARNYVVLHAAGRTHIVRATLEGLLEQLDPAQFIPTSRSSATWLCDAGIAPISAAAAT